MKYAMIFDMDGVLIDSYKPILESHRELLGRQGICLSPADIKGFIGKSVRDKVEDWKARYGYTLDFKAHSEASWEIQKRMLRKMKANLGLIALLDELKSKNIPMGVGTCSGRLRADFILDALKISNYFKAVVTADDVRLHKPNPDIYLGVARMLGTCPERCAVIEDAQDGIKAAKKGGMIAIGYLNGNNDFDEVKNAHKIIKSFSELSYPAIAKLFESRQDLKRNSS